MSKTISYRLKINENQDNTADKWKLIASRNGQKVAGQEYHISLYYAIKSNMRAEDPL